ncbi:LysR family transcriptional regulator [Chromobacterium sp. Beijing]|uniref:helix-turn-helix domain-containing protein n=1 Tax=Chromobacterium sp. Beijing TaxID=2735795 RepID=UPI001F3DAEDC|nr:LysR family transcriptional regulator [Chromobacterium sp. Beijing]UJB29613.1 LysR family transcriptional regulator [Chromobacterium sp. Beijing]
MEKRANTVEAVFGRLNDTLDWNLLRTYLVIVEERGISRAAARLHLTQPAISRSLQRLEEHLNMRLISQRSPQHFPARPEEGFASPAPGCNLVARMESPWGTISRIESLNKSGPACARAATPHHHRCSQP